MNRLNVFRFMFMAGCLLLASTAHADEFQSVRSKAVSAFNAGQYQDAARLFSDAFTIKPKGNLLYNIGLSYERAGQLGDALRFYQRFVDALPESPRRPAVQQKLDALRQQLAGTYHTLSVMASIPNAAVYIDDKSKGAYGRTPVDVRLLPGEYTVIVEHPGYEPTRERVRLTGSGQTKVQVQLIPSNQVGALNLIISERGANVMLDNKKVGRSPLMEPVRVSAGTHTLLVMKPGFAVWRQSVEVRAGATNRIEIQLQNEAVTQLSGPRAIGGTNIWPWVLTGVGGAMLAGSVVTGVMANSLHGKLEEKSSRNELIHKDDVSSGESLVLMTNIFAGVGGALAVGGIVWWLLDDSGVDRRGRVSASVGPLDDGGAYIQLGGAF
ncbi:MAG: PEGA domain-containing protein [Myxococcota bacterium]|nr:PEGA domain-containing protein [Myxococcota bacterium]